MSMKLTEEKVNEIEIKVLHDLVSPYDWEDERDIVRTAFYTEGIKDMANAVRYAIKELDKS